MTDQSMVSMIPAGPLLQPLQPSLQPLQPSLQHPLQLPHHHHHLPPSLGFGGFMTAPSAAGYAILGGGHPCGVTLGGPQLPVVGGGPMFDEEPTESAAHPLLRYDPVDHLRHMGQTLWEQKVFTDLTIVCDGADLMRVHRSVMAAASPVFAAMLQGDMTEARERRIEFRETEPAVVEAMLQFVYTGSLPKGVDSRAILNLAHMYGIQGLAAYCCHSLVSTLSVDNVVESVRVLRACSDNDVAQRAFRAVCDKVFADRDLFDIVARRV